MRRKLLFVVNVDWFFVSHRLPIAIEAIKNGFEVHLACAITDKRELLENVGIIVHDTPLTRSGLNIIFELKTLILLHKVVKKVKPDIVHSITIKPIIYANIISRLLGVKKRVSSISGLGYVFIDNSVKTKCIRRVVSSLYKVALKNIDAVIFQNSSDRAIVSSLNAFDDSKSIMVRGSGVDLRQFILSQEPVYDKVVMFVGRFLKDKGIIEFVKSAQLLRLKNVNARFVLVGGIDALNPNSITKLELDSWVNEGFIEHWGYSANISEDLNQANIVVLPSYREGLPKSLLEAAAAQRAVVTTDVPGCRDAIEPNETGLLVEVKNPQALAEGILKLLNDNELRKKFAENGRLLAEKEFNIKDVVKTHMHIYIS